uniref:Uncharacterized protein n=1 Tax=Rhizophora mucronata TaxID=61149 RepID=A0A2P2K6V8_RHIMU
MGRPAASISLTGKTDFFEDILLVFMFVPNQKSRTEGAFSNLLQNFILLHVKVVPTPNPIHGTPEPKEPTR